MTLRQALTRAHAVLRHRAEESPSSHYAKEDLAASEAIWNELLRMEREEKKENKKKR